MSDIDKNKQVGRPTKYKPEYAEIAYKFCLLGADDNKLADMLEVDVATIYRWKIAHQDFCEALKEGKERADAEIAKALYHRAKGYSHPDVDVKVIDGQVVMVDFVKHYPPDTGAAMAWLKNRQPKYWRDKQELDVTSSDGSAGNVNINIDTKAIKEIATKLNDEC